MRSGDPPSPRLRRARCSLRLALRTKRRMERVTRLELATSSLARRCSTTELHPRLEGVEIMAQQAHSATVNSAEWRSARLMPDSLPLLHQSIILFRLHATNSAHSPRAAIS